MNMLTTSDKLTSYSEMHMQIVLTRVVDMYVQLLNTCTVDLFSDLKHLQVLMTEAVSKGYNASETFDELRASIQEAEKCAEAALQTSLGRRRVGGAGGTTSVGSKGGASSSAKRMNVDELVKFLEQVESLPCKIPEANILQVCMCIYTLIKAGSNRSLPQKPSGRLSPFI